MKVKVITRDPEEFTRSRKNDIFKMPRNLKDHPFERAREYKRAEAHAKWERIFAKPFIGSLECADGVYSLAKHGTDLNTIASGSIGEIKLWDLMGRRCVWQESKAHEGVVQGITFYNDVLISCGIDKTVKLWKPRSEEPLVATFHGKQQFTSLDHHLFEPIFATGSTQVEIWNHEKNLPTTLTFGHDTITSVRFNPIETHMLAASAERTLSFYDIRSTPVSKLTMKMKINALCWNPIEAYNLTVASEDHNLYTFDMRKLDKAMNIHKDHVSAVLDVDYAPTGQEFVTASYDKTIRIFGSRDGHSREIYHTKRMQHAFCVKFTMDSNYVLSGSDDCNVRIWKARPQNMAPKNVREKQHLEYGDKLKQRFGHMPAIKKILNHREVPKAIKSAKNLKREMLESRKKKKENMARHQANPASRKPERAKVVIAHE